MIEKLGIKNRIDVYDFIIDTNDIYQDFYITINKERKFLKNLNLINKLLKKQECYGLLQNGLQGLLIIIREKNFRPYVKILSKNRKYAIDLLKFLKWNFSDKTLFFKLKKTNPLSQMILKTGFVRIGDRGQELLFEKKIIKDFKKLTPKDDYLPKNEHRLY